MHYRPHFRPEITRLTALLLCAAVLLPSYEQVTPATAASGYVSASPATSGLLAPDGKPLFLSGVNYVGYTDRGWRMWEDGLFDTALIEKDFLKAKAAGANTVRMFVRRPLPDEVLAGKWQKLDSVVALARKQHLYLLITLYDYGEADLTKVVEVDRRIAQHYANEDTILGYDLKNEPHLYDLTTVHYPTGVQPPMLGGGLIKQYGQRMTAAEANDWRTNGAGKGLVPSWFDSQQNYLFANNYRIYLDFLADASAWVAGHNYDVSALDYLDSPEAAKWRGVTEALDQTLAAWLTPQLDAIRAVDSHHLVTVGYSDVILAKLPANKTLDYQSVHRYPGQQIKPMRVALSALDNIKKSFPGEPVALTEFGYSTNDLDAAQSAIYETAVGLYVLSHQMAGGLKWNLNDVANGANPQENSYGLYTTTDAAKPSATSLRAVADYVGDSPPTPGKLSFDQDSTSGLRYSYTAPDAFFVGGKDFQGPGLVMHAEGPGQVFLSWRDRGALRIVSTNHAALEIDPAALLGDDTITAQYQLVQIGDKAGPQTFTQRGTVVVFNTEPGQVYELRLSRSTVNAKIEIVWPQNNLPVDQADKVNIAAYLFDRNSNKPVCSSWAQPVRLWRSLNNGVEEPVVAGLKRDFRVGSLTFPVWDFNNVGVKEARDPQNKYYFRLSTDGSVGYSNIWSHGADARTYFPQPDVPQTVLASIPGTVDAKIEIVWPHESKPVTEATQVNIGAYLFDHGTLNSVPASYSGPVRLWAALNNDNLKEVAVGQKVTKPVGDLTVPVWEFDNVDVSAARDPQNKYYFRLTVDNTTSFSNVWSHSADARTYLPQPDVPTEGGSCP